jgi:hypothetical protein
MYPVMFHCTDELTTYLKILLFQHISTRLWRDVIQARLLNTRPTNAVEIFESCPLFYAIQTNIARLELLIANLWLELLPLWFEANTCVYFYVSSLLQQFHSYEKLLLQNVAPVKDIEILTGISFFSNLPAQLQVELSTFIPVELWA